MEECRSEFDVARGRLIQRLRQEIADERVLEAMDRVPRHLFVPQGSRHQAYEDHPLSIGDGQTISQPFMVALMTAALGVSKDDVVLEVGTGSGYQTAILAHLARYVVSVERLPGLAERAREALHYLRYANVEVHLASRTLGWEASAPYDRITVTAAAPYVPQTLLDQLKDGGRMVIPVGSRHEQELLVVSKHGDRISRRALVACRFVLLIGEEAWE